MTNRQKLFIKIVAEQNKAMEHVTAPAEWHRASAEEQCPDCGIPGYDRVKGCAVPYQCCGCMER